MIIAVMHTSSAAVKLNARKNLGLNGIRTHDLIKCRLIAKANLFLTNAKMDVRAEFYCLF